MYRKYQLLKQTYKEKGLAALLKSIIYTVLGLFIGVAITIIIYVMFGEGFREWFAAKWNAM